MNVVIVTYKNEASLTHLVDQLYAEKNRPKVYVIDNANGENKAIKRIAESKEFVYLPSKNIGYGKAFNLAVEKFNLLQKNEPLFLLNDDVILKENTLTNLIYFSKSLPSNWGYIAPKNVEEGKEFDNLLKQNLKSNIEVDFLPASFWLLNTSALKKVGLFHRNFFMYGEDKELSNRLNVNKFKNYYCAEAEVIHSFDYSELSLRMRYHFVKGNLTWILHDKRLNKRIVFLQTVKMYLLHRGIKWWFPLFLAILRVVLKYRKHEQIDK